MKNSPWEGAMRCSAAIWSPLIRKPQRVSDQLMHISDWLPTFFSAAGKRVESDIRVTVNFFKKQQVPLINHPHAKEFITPSLLSFRCNEKRSARDIR